MKARVSVRTTLLSAFAVLVTTMTHAGPASAAIESIGAGAASTCAMNTAGTVYCWGSNQYGQLGTNFNSGTTNPNPTPSTVELGATAKQLTAGFGHTCVTADTGTAMCFGENAYGELGTTNNNTTSNPNPAPAPISMGATATAVTAGIDHTCAVVGSGEVKCFGDNFYGQLGSVVNVGTTDPNPTPMSVTLGAPVTQLVLGRFHSCARLADGSVKCFGRNKLGQLGNATNSGTDSPNAAGLIVSPGAPVSQLAAANLTTCALLNTGVVKCFGSNGSGQFGDGTSNSIANPTPSTMSLGAAATEIAVGGYHVCALMGSGEVKCAGDNYYGQLGNAANHGTTTPNTTPLTVDLGGSAVHIAAGEYHTCALMSDGAVKCFGRNGSGELGSSFAGYSYFPLQVPGLDLIPDVPAPVVTKPAAVLNRPRFRVHRTRPRIDTTLYYVGASGNLPSSACSGAATITVTLRGRRVRERTVNIAPAAADCAARVNFTLPRKARRKRVRVTVTLSAGAACTAATVTFVVRV
ncbi:MAG: hypothetical protein HY827_05495 [Actinobacteria bacterium]|nr:hypothetical protein [Actinomycetota bacterium]